ncbi:MAG: competence protein, partial [Mesorhizobium sp.]|nr:competence protein [Mesorhizobium sp.]
MSADVAAGVSERELFLGVSHAEPVPLAPPLPQSAPGHRLPEQARRDAIAVAPIAGGLNRLRRRVSLPAIGREIAATASLELDRGVAFLLVPVLLATGAIAYFSLTTEPDFYRPAAVAAL